MRHPADQAPVAPAFEVVEELARSFQHAAEQGSPPSIVAYLGQVKDGLQPTLLRNLLQVDNDLRIS